MNEKGKMNLLDLFNKIHAENTAKQETMLKIEYNANNVKSHLFVYADLKPTMRDASYCISDENEDLICFEFMFKNGFGTTDYENYVYESFDKEIDNLEDELMKKHCFIFYALINPTFLLGYINKEENIKQLIENNKITIELIDAELIIEISTENLVL